MTHARDRSGTQPVPVSRGVLDEGTSSARVDPDWKAVAIDSLFPRAAEDYQRLVRRMIGVMLRQRREHLHITRAVLARALGVAEQTVGHYETGHTAMNSDALAFLARYLRVPVGYFFGEAAADGPQAGDDRDETLRQIRDMPPELAEAARGAVRAIHAAAVSQRGTADEFEEI